MKPFILSILMLFVLTANAQNEWQYLDTLNAGETVINYPNEAASDTLAKAFGWGSFYVTIVSDSLSGNTGVTNEIQYTTIGKPYSWITQSGGTLSSSGAAQQTLIFNDDFFGADKIRVKSTATGNTQATKIEIRIRFKPASPTWPF